MTAAPPSETNSNVAARNPIDLSRLPSPATVAPAAVHSTAEGVHETGRHNALPAAEIRRADAPINHDQADARANNRVNEADVQIATVSKIATVVELRFTPTVQERLRSRRRKHRQRIAGNSR